MSKLNKLVTNYPVELTEEEISNLSGTLAPVIAACGGGGGGTGGKIYTGIGFVSVNNTTNQIGLTNEANTKLNQDIPTKVSDLSDSANYQTIAGMDEYLTTANAQTLYQTKNDMSAYLTSANASSTYQTKEDMTAYLTTANANSDYAKKTLVETVSGNIVAKIPTKTSQLSNDKPFLILQDMVNYGPGWMDLNDGLSTKQDTLTFGYDENDAISSIDNTPLAGQGGKTYTPGQYIDITNDEISVTGVLALDEYAQYEPVLIGDSNITATSSKIDNHTQWNLAINSTPVVTDTKLVGENSITAHTTNVSGEWLVGLEQTAHNAIASIDGISTDVGTLKTASAGWDKVSNKLDTTSFSTVSGSFLTAHQSLDDYATKTDISDMATQTWVGEQGFYTKASGDNDYAPKSVTGTVNTLTGASAGWNEVTAKLDKSIYSNASGNWEASYNVLTSYSAAGTWLTAHQSLTNYYTKSETSGAGELSTEFAKYVTSSNVTAQDTDYVMTTTGWKVLTLPGGGMTQVYHDTTLTGDGNANDNQLGVVWSALSGNTIASALSADVAIYYYDTVDNMPIGISTAINGIYNSLDNCLLTGDIMPDNGISGGYNSQAQVVELGLTQTAYNAVTSVSSKLDTTAFSTVSGTFLTKSSADNDYAPISITTTVNTLTAASAGWNNKVDKPTSFNDKYLVLRTDSNGAVSGWCDFQDQSYSKSEALGTFVATANIDTTTLSGDGKSVSTKLGVKTDVIATIDYVNSSFLPLSGGTVSGLTTISGSDFDNTLEVKRAGQANNFAHIGLNNSRGLSFKAFDTNASTNVQFDLFPNNSNSALIQVQHNGSTVGNLIPAVTATTTAGLTNDGILHIILES